MQTNWVYSDYDQGKCHQNCTFVITLAQFLYDESVAIFVSENAVFLLNLLNSAAKCRETWHTVIVSKEGSSMFLNSWTLV